MIEFLFELFGELILQVVVQLLAEFGLHLLTAPFRDDAGPWAASAGYAIFGAVAGGLSLLAFPASLLHGPWRAAHVVLTPIVLGALMSLVGAWRARRGQVLLRIDRFFYGWLFALALALVRYAWATP